MFNIILGGINVSIKYNPLVTVVITTYKRPIAVLERAITSVTNQKYKNLEIIVVNDFPEDEKHAKEIMHLIGKIKSNGVVTNIKYLSPSKNSGACFVRNMGLNHAQGEYISFLDDDDYWLPEKIDVQLSGFKTENVGVVYTPYFLYYKSKKELVKTVQLSGNLTESLLFKNTMCIFPLMKTSLVREVNGFDVNLTASQEHDLLLRLSMITDFQFVNTPVAVYDVSAESISMNIEKKIKAFEAFMTKHEYLYNQYPDAKYNQLIKMVNNMNNAGKYGYSLKIWKEAISIRPYSLQNIVQPLKGFTKRLVGIKPFH